MSDPGEIASAIIVLFVGLATIASTWAALYGGDVSAVTSIVSALAVPVVVLSLIAFFVVAMVNAAQNGAGR